MKRSLGVLVVAMVVLPLPGMAPAAQKVVVDQRVEVEDWLSSYVVRIVGDSPPESAAAWEGSFDGPIMQHLAMAIFETPTLTYASRLGSYESRDSHFLLWDDDLITRPLSLFTPPPITENDMYLGMSAAFAADVQTQDLQFAQIVAPNGWTVNMKGISTDQAGERWNTVASIKAGDGTWTASWEQDSSVPDGMVNVGQPIHAQGTPHSYWATQYAVSRTFEITPGGPLVTGMVATFTDPEFEFIPTEPGTYTLTRFLGFIDGGPVDGPALTFVVVPEPVTFALLAAGALALLRRRGGAPSSKGR